MVFVSVVVPLIKRHDCWRAPSGNPIAEALRSESREAPDRDLSRWISNNQLERGLACPDSTRDNPSCAPDDVGFSVKARAK